MPPVTSSRPHPPTVEQPAAFPEDAGSGRTRELRGWGGRIRTSAWRNQNPPDRGGGGSLEHAVEEDLASTPVRGFEGVEQAVRLVDDQDRSPPHGGDRVGDQERRRPLAAARLAVFVIRL